MASSRRHLIILVSAMAVSACLVAGCSSSKKSAGPPAATDGTTPASGTGASSTSTTSGSSTTASSSSTTGSSAVGAGTGCPLSQLTVTLGPTDSGAGNQYTPIVFTNTGTTPCTLTGFPGVSLVDAGGTQVGPAAERGTGASTPVTVAPGATAHATIDFHDAGLYPASDCLPQTVASLRVIPPNLTQWVDLPFAQQVCTQPVHQLTVQTVSAGAAGTP